MLQAAPALITVRKSNSGKSLPGIMKFNRRYKEGLTQAFFSRIRHGPQVGHTDLDYPVRHADLYPFTTVMAIKNTPGRIWTFPYFFIYAFDFY